MFQVLRRYLSASVGLGCLMGQMICAPAQANPVGIQFQGDANAVFVAQQLGFPPVPPNTGIIGPFSDDQGLIYLDAQGRISYFSPSQVTVFFAQANANNDPKILYALTPTATYTMQNNQAIAVDPNTIEAAITPWPYSGVMVNVLIAYLQQYQAQLMASGGVTVSAEQQSYVSSMLHNTSMNILNNIGSEGCTEHYEDVYYLGCW
ncbi:hypothetical protein [Picosynechococcus sp. PCC 73109]|uniref:hypothetical protein n=1 Tax=Picosynechococcus sp. PCC 73109 TaxID=374982 RepID=UPI000745964D|nr:hypothetical protein [Picosynechococcus sp. PCC 73109]AMA09888.1 hypothetical protein AWQ23_11480 [Picosynechococcus sp. PCC 73109]